MASRSLSPQQQQHLAGSQRHNLRLAIPSAGNQAGLAISSHDRGNLTLLQLVTCVIHRSLPTIPRRLLPVSSIDMNGHRYLIKALVIAGNRIVLDDTWEDQLKSIVPARALLDDLLIQIW